MEPWKRTLYVSLFGVFLTGMGLSQIAPILPLYMSELGVTSQESIAWWSGLAMGITYITIAVVSPFWGRLSDRKGRKLTLLRASFGMMITSTLMGFVTSPEQLVLCRAAQGLISGFYSGSIALIATESPKEHSGWALGLLASANVCGSLVGPLIGGYLAGLFGISNSFFIIAFLLFLAFLLTLFFIHETYIPPEEKIKQGFSVLRRNLEHFDKLLTMAASTFIYAMAFMSLQPVLTIFVAQLLPSDHEQIAFISGLVFSITGIAQMLSSTYLGRLIDKIGARKVFLYSLLYVVLLTIPHMYMTDIYQLCVLRFLIGLGYGGLLPSINAFLSTHTPKEYIGQVFSYNGSTQFIGSFLGAVGGAMVVGAFGFEALFWGTGLLFILNGLWAYYKLKE